MGWLDKLSVEFELGEIMAMDAESFMCPLSVRLEEYGKISQRVFRVGGSEFIAELCNIRNQLPDEKLLLGQSLHVQVQPNYGFGSYKYVVLTALWDNESEYNRNLFYKAYLTAFRTAINLNIKSIVVPAMGYDGNLPVSSAALLSVIQELDELKSSDDFSLEDIYVVSSNSIHIDYLRSHVEAALYR